MKLQSSRSRINSYMFNNKIFQTIKIPENRKGIDEIQKCVIKLKKSVKLLDQSKSKDKINQRNSIYPSKSVIIKNKKSESNDIINDNKSETTNRSNTNTNDNTQNNNNKSRLYKDKLSVLNKILKNKNKKINNTDINNNINNISAINIDLIKKYQRKMSNINKGETFMTSFDNTQNNNNDKSILKTELNNPNNKNILNKKDNKSRLSLPRIEPKSTRGLIIEQRNKRNDRIKSQRLRPNFSFDNKRISEIINNCENEKGKEMSYIIQLNKKLVSLFGYDYKHSTPSRPDVANFIKKLKNIKKILNKKNEQYELDKLIIKAKMKYVDWKLGNNESEKYFTNNEFNLKEKNGADMRKSFYKKLNFLTDASKEEKENKKTKEKDNKKTKTFYIDLKKEDEKLFKNNDQWNNDKALNLLKEQYHCLKKVKERKIKEQKNRDIIQRIIIKSRQRAFNINNS